MIRHPWFSSRRFRVGPAVLLSISLGALSLAPRPACAATPKQIEDAIEKAQNWLVAQQKGKAIPGTWEVSAGPHPGGGPTDLNSHQWGGTTAIATYAMLASGVNPQDEQLKRAIQFLERANIEGTYGLGLSSQIVWPEFGIPVKDIQPLIKHNVNMLEAGLIVPPNLKINSGGWAPNVGFYGYWTGTPNGTNQPLFNPGASLQQLGTHQPGDHYDRSNSQYGVLGMWALEEAGGEIPTTYWQIVDTAWKRAQKPDGSWNYSNDDEARPSMTAAGVATLFITQDYTTTEDWGSCRGGIRNEYIERGLKWMDVHIKEALTQRGPYTMYGVERIGAASGRKYFAGNDWYQIGADFLVKTQHPDGSWDSEWGPVPGTAYAILFMSRGRAPVFMNKLQYADPPKLPRGQGDVWNERPRDVANLARWVGRQTEGFFNWQVVNLKANPEDLHDAPILYLSGSTDLEFKPAEINKLRAFVEEGGMILGNADCGKEAFTRGFQKLGHTLFPRYEFRRVAPTDLIWNEQFKKWRSKPPVMELSNNVRKLMVLIPEFDPARAWQTRAYSTKEAAYELGANIFLYAGGGKNMYKKGESYVVAPNPKVQPTQSLAVARLEVGDNPDPEPGGWRRLAAIFHNDLKIDLKVDSVKPDKLSAGAYKIAHLTGTGALAISQAQRAALQKFVESGGTLIVDAGGGDAIFADSVEVDLKQMFPNQTFATPALTSDLYTNPMAPLEKLGWRNYAADRLASKREPKVMAMKVASATGADPKAGDRYRVFLSRYDLSAGLVGENVDGVLGYDPATATRIMEALLLYAGNIKPPATQPTTQPGGPAAPVASSEAPPPPPAPGTAGPGGK